MRPVIVAGARPNFMKIAPILRAFEARGIPASFVHTGQHYDADMSDNIFRDLALRTPDANFEVRSGSHAVQTAKVMIAFDGWLDEHPETDTLIVVGDVNSTLACTLVAAKRSLSIAHVEAGLRSDDREMPEEVNRIAVDSLASWLLTPSPDADLNLLAEGVRPERIHAVGNVMVDSLFDAIGRLPSTTTVSGLGLGPKQYALVTLHRPALVDDIDKLSGMLRGLAELSETVPVVFPVHPRTRERISHLGISLPPTVHLTGPLSYLDFVAAQHGARVVVTDSGGVQEETTCLGVPCITARPTTERPITVTEGTNRVVGIDPAVVIAATHDVLANPPAPRRPALWDGHAAERVLTAVTSTTPTPAWFARDVRPAVV